MKRAEPEPRMCPSCQSYFTRRKGKNCPHCGEPLILRNGQYLSAKEKPDSKAIYYLWRELARAAGLMIYHQKFSKVFWSELALANTIIENARKYLAEINYHDVTAQTFAEEYVRYMMGQRYVLRITCDNQSLAVIANGLFWKHAAAILEIVKSKRQAERVQQLASTTSFNVSVLPLG